MRENKWLVLGLLAFVQFMLVVDITVVQIALPSIGTDLGLGRQSLTWVVTTYTLVFGGLMILGGRLADVLGARRTLLAGLVIFTLASATSGLAGSAAVLIAGRAAQGLGAALLSPAALAIVTTTFHDRDRSRALGIWAAIGGAGAAVGVLLGGLLTAGPGWQWVFYVNVPIGVAVLVLLPQLVPAQAGAGRAPIDLPGALLVTAATALLIYGLVNAGEDGWGAASTLGVLAAAALSYGLFLLVEARTATPLMDLRTMGRRPVVSGMFLMLVATGLLLGLFFLTSPLLQEVRGYSALETGLVFLPVALAITGGAQVGGHLIGRVGGRAVAAGSFLVTALGAALLTQVGDSVWTGVLPGFLLAAFGVGPLFVTAMTTTMANVPTAEAGVASGVVTTFHELGGSIGVAVMSTVAAASFAGPTVVSTDGFSAGYAVCAIAAAVAGVIALLLVPGGKALVVAGHGHGH
ncbi:DHA2 family efflux MFS transporter permease subunit [Kribbella koreensis]|uniref:DHA2 family efflux MFS transporter permease subunit n=1 Tax=Kribbella koreensis TaxID=57909 RepID=A0ABP4A221_9ACTN